MSNFFGKVQKLGKAFMLPVAAMPVAALMLRLGQPDVFNVPFIAAAGDAIFANLAILFAIGIAFGIAKDNHGAAGLAGAVGYFVLTKGTASINPEINMGVLAGILAGLIGGFCYNKFNKTKLPDFLGFFGGRRFVPIITSFVCIVLSFLLGYIWPHIQSVIDAVGNWFIGAGAIGVGAYGFFNRLLIPTGLHHVINNIVWFIFGEFNGATGDLNRFFAGDPNAGIFMAGFFPMMMFGLPAAALAMIKTAKPQNRKAVTGALLGVAFTSFLTGITEPIEFMFMFLAPVLYITHAAITGVSLAVCYLLGIKHGFGFSAGAIDYFLNMNLATNGWLIIPVGIVFGIIYYFLFVIIINKMNLPTPGRMDEEGGANVDEIIAERGISGLAKLYLEKLGGKDNILELDSCITRLRLTVADSSIISDDELKALGASGVLRPNKKNMQVVVGTKAELIVDEMKKLM